MKYAAKTRVPVEKTRLEIERAVKRYGAKGFVSGWQGEAVRVEFLCHGRHIRMTMAEPPADQAKRQTVDAKIATFEEAFLGDIVMPETGRTVWETTREPIKLAYDGRPSPALLGAP